MRKNKWLLTKTMIYFAFIAINLSCEKDLYDDAVYKPEKSTIKEVKFDELFKDSKFKSLLQSVSNNSNIARSAFENQNGFTISNTNVKVIQTDSITSYTMLIQRDSVFNSSYFENLVIQEDIFNNQKAFIIKYTPNQITSTVDNSFAFQGKIKKSQIAFTGFNRSGSYQNTTQADCYIEVLMCSYGEDHVAGQGCVDKPNPTLYLKKIAVLCQDNGGGSGGSGDISIGDPFNGGGGSSGSDGDDLGDPFSGGSSSGGSGNGSTNTNNDGFDSEVVTSPISNQDIINTYLFYNSLSPNQQSWANENVDAYNQLIQYQINNNWSDESEQFAEAALETLCSGGEVDFENKVMLDSTFVNNQKVMCIYTKMRTINAFNKALEPFEGASSKAFIKLKTDLLPNSVRAETSEPYTNNVITITLNNCSTCQNGINYQPNTLISPTIIHEVLHAEFFRRIIVAINNGSYIHDYDTIVNALENSQYSQLAEYIRTTRDWSHNYMAENFRRAIARVTQEYDTGIEVNGTPDAFYTNLAWRGLTIYGDPITQGGVIAWNNIVRPDPYNPSSTATNILALINNFVLANANQSC